MNKGLGFCTAMGIGSGLMYMLDPDRGKRRRALLRDKFVWVTRKTGEGIETTAWDLSNRARGIAASVQSRFSPAEISDSVLADRVRSKLGRIVSHPGALEVAAENGSVTISGPILEAEVDNLLTCVGRIQGVNEVNNKLEVHQEAGDHPSLQGGRERRGYQFEFLQENWSPAARFIAGAAGASLAVYGGARRDVLGAGLGAAGLLLLARGVTNTELKRMVGFNDETKTDGNGSSTAVKVGRTQDLFAQSSDTI
jgi:hypothetical protein